MNITFLGAVGTVTGSKYLLTTEGSRVLVDCGLFQGFTQLRLRNWAPLPIDPRQIAAVILTHAHLDHSGYIPLLVKNGFSGRIICTEATRDLCGVLLPDSGYLQEQDADFANRHGYSKHKPALPLYTREDAGRPMFVATLFSCLGTTSETASFLPLWHPPFIWRLAAEDRCHLNGLAMKDGKPAYISAVSATDVTDGWREHRRDGGIVIDVTSGETVVSGLSMPHSARLHDSTLYLLDSGTGHFGKVGLKAGKFEPIAFCPGYLRGLVLVDRFAIVGLSRPRDDNKTFAGLALGEAMQAKNVEAHCGVMVIDLKTSDTVHWLRAEGVVEELYDVVALPGVRRPMALGFKTDEIRRTVTLAEPGS